MSTAPSPRRLRQRRKNQFQKLVPTAHDGMPNHSSHRKNRDYESMVATSTSRRPPSSRRGRASPAKRKTFAAWRGLAALAGFPCPSEAPCTAHAPQRLARFASQQKNGRAWNRSRSGFSLNRVTTCPRSKTSRRSSAAPASRCSCDCTRRLCRFQPTACNLSILACATRSPTRRSR